MNYVSVKGSSALHVILVASCASLERSMYIKILPFLLLPQKDCLNVRASNGNGSENTIGTASLSKASIFYPRRSARDNKRQANIGRMF